MAPALHATSLGGQEPPRPQHPAHHQQQSNWLLPPLLLSCQAQQQQTQLQLRARSLHQKLPLLLLRLMRGGPLPPPIRRVWCAAVCRPPSGCIWPGCR